ncbi:MAG: threonine synthase [Candidatus Bathyarchaeota archaeon]
MSYFTHLECSKCGKKHDHTEVQTVCKECGKPLFARYDMEAVKEVVGPEDFVGGEASMWRYWDLLPVKDPVNKVSLGEGWTPLTHVTRLGETIGLPDLYVKDEGIISTGTFKARGLAMAVSKAKELGIRRLALPSAGNAAGAMTAYGARAGMESYVFMPVDAPDVNKVECQVVGAKVVLVEGLITDAGKMVADGIPEMDWFPLSTLKEPYRVEGKKTMGLEVAEQFDWELPDVIIYPTGGGTGIIGMWKVFDELEELGWIGSERPRMVSVQASGCAPIPKAFDEGKEESEFWEGAETLAAGLRVPHALGDFLVLRAVRESGGSAVAVPDDKIMDDVGLIAREEGLFACPEGAATLSGLKRLLADGQVDRDERVVLFNTGSGLKYTDLFEVEAPTYAPGDEINYKDL